MAPKLNRSCCRTKLGTFFVLIIAAAVVLMSANYLTYGSETADKVFSSASRIRGAIINNWRKDREESHDVLPVMDPVPCEGKKCKEYLHIFGMDDKNGAQGKEKLIQHCKHPLLQLENDTIAHAFYKLSPLTCGKMKKNLFHYSNGYLTPDSEAVCLLEEITRSTDNDNQVFFTSPRILSPSSTLLMSLTNQTDFFRIQCVQKTVIYQSIEEELMVSNLKAFLSLRDADHEKFIIKVTASDDDTEPCSTTNCLPYNVLILGIGSLSQMSFRRLLPKTHKFFTNKLKSINMNEYNVVEYGSTGALLPMLTGLREAAHPKIQKYKEGSHFMDKLDFIWNEYDQNGYKTLYAEDHPPTNTFNERMHGFEVPPTMHYMRPFWLATELSSLRNTSKPYCLGAKPKHKYLLDYVSEFLDTYSNSSRTFAVAMLKELTLTDVNHAQLLDEDLLNFLQHQISKYLGDTIVFLMSDHGVTPHKAASYFPQAKAEARMPLMSVYLPTSFLKDYSDLAHNMTDNENKLTTAYDIHATLKKIINLRNHDKANDDMFGKSLFSNLPVSRTCKSAGIDVHWCGCLRRFVVRDELSSKVYKDMKQLILAELNKKTEQYRTQCELYTNIYNLIDVIRLVPGEQIAEYENTNEEQFTVNTVMTEYYYQVTFEADTGERFDRPKDAYEVTIEYKPGGILQSDDYKFISDLIPLNVHDCAVSAEVRQHCACMQTVSQRETREEI